MDPGLLLFFLGGYLLALAAFVWLLYRLGGFKATARERRMWSVIAVLLMGWVALLAFIGPLPPLLILVANVVAIGWFVWGWRTGRFKLDRVPADSRAEARQRRQWMRDHRGTLTALVTGFVFVTLVWSFIVFVLARVGLTPPTT